MATTDSRTGFRLPWSTDRSASREATAEPADEPVAGAPEPALDAGAAIAPEQTQPASQDAAGDAVRGEEEDPVTTLAPDAAPFAGHAGTAATPVPAAPDGPAATSVQPAVPLAGQAPARRPTKFLADLTKAMQTAAEQARVVTLDQFRADGTGVIEEIHARSATGADDLRRRADDDVAAIKDWSKAEIARIREETEHRVGSRREQLEGQLERHAALIEHEIEKVRRRIATFEAEMGTFFDELLREEDPAVFAARAANLPEPPSFDTVDADALAALLHEPGVGVPAPVADEPAEAIAEAASEPVVEPVVEAVAGAEEPPVGTAEVEAGETDASFDREAAMAAIQASAEAAASVDVEPPSVATEATAESEAVEPGAEAAEAAAEADTTVDAEAEAAEPVAEAVPAADAEPEPAVVAADPEPELDPRLAMLGLTPDFAAAEMAAAEAAAAESDIEVPEIADDVLAARLSGLVPADAPAEQTPTSKTQVVVTGLVSVASIASFKRHLGRLPGVLHVGVSSGPDGEFVFSVEHETTTSLRDLVPTIPDFGARVVGDADGIVQVSAQDLQD